METRKLEVWDGTKSTSYLRMEKFDGRIDVDVMTSRGGYEETLLSILPGKGLYLHSVVRNDLPLDEHGKVKLVDRAAYEAWTDEHWNED